MNRLEERVADQSEIAFLQKKKVDPRAAWAVQDKLDWPMEQLAWNEYVPVTYHSTVRPVRNYSSWSRCADAGLVEYGWFGHADGPDGECLTGPKFWGIRLTDEGRAAMLNAVEG